MSKPKITPRLAGLSVHTRYQLWENTRSANPIELENPATPGLGSIKSQSWPKWSVAKRSRNRRGLTNRTRPRLSNRPDTGHGCRSVWVFFQCKLSHASRRRIFYNTYDFDYLISSFLSFFIIKARLIYVKISAFGICVLSKDSEDQARNLITDQ